MGLNQYIADITKLERKRYTIDQEKCLITLARHGNVIARDTLIKINMQFIVRAAMNYRYRTLKLEDLISEGVLGINDAILKFDMHQNIRFLSYAAWHIKARMSRIIDETERIVRVPSNKKLQLSKQMRTVGYDNLSDLMKQVYATQGPQKSLSEPMGDRELEEHFGYEQDFDSNLSRGKLRSMLKHALKYLSRKEQHIIIKLYGLNGEEDVVLSDLAEVHGMTKEGVRQVHLGALEKLKRLRYLKGIELQDL